MNVDIENTIPYYTIKIGSQTFSHLDTEVTFMLLLKYLVDYSVVLDTELLDISDDLTIELIQLDKIRKGIG